MGENTRLCEMPPSSDLQHCLGTGDCPFSPSVVATHSPGILAQNDLSPYMHVLGLPTGYKRGQPLLRKKTTKTHRARTPYIPYTVSTYVQIPLPEPEVEEPRIAVDASEGEALDGHAVLRTRLRHVPLPGGQRLEGTGETAKEARRREEKNPRRAFFFHNLEILRRTITHPHT